MHMCMCPYAYVHVTSYLNSDARLLTDNPSLWFPPYGLKDILHILDIMCPYDILLMVCMTFSTCLISCVHILFSSWFECMCPHDSHHVSICCSPHGFHDILLMLDIISPYSILHMVCDAFSSCVISCLHMLFSTWMAVHSPHVWYHVSICYSPHDFHGILLMLGIMPPYVSFHMLCMAFSSCFISCLHMLLSTWFAWHSPHAKHHVSICYSPHGIEACVLMSKTIYHQQRQTMRTYSAKA